MLSLIFKILTDSCSLIFEIGIPEIIETVSATSLSEISTNSLSSIVVLNLLLIEAILLKFALL